MEKTLAQKCYEFVNIEDELFTEVNKILGCPSFEDCNKENFVWGCYDTWWDEYDDSIEVVRTLGSEWMTREQADQILALGFGQIYETIGDTAKQWTRNSCSNVSPTSGGDDEAQRLRIRLKTLLAQDA